MTVPSAPLASRGQATSGAGAGACAAARHAAARAAAAASSLITGDECAQRRPGTVLDQGPTSPRRPTVYLGAGMAAPRVSFKVTILTLFVALTVGLSAIVLWVSYRRNSEA